MAAETVKKISKAPITGNYIIETTYGEYHQDLEISKNKTMALYKGCLVGDVIEVQFIPGSKQHSFLRNITQEKIDALINNPRQDAVVLDYYYMDNNDNTYIKCWNPVWKEIEFTQHRHIPLRYNDIITIEKSESGRYWFVTNKTLDEEKNKAIKNKLLAGFTDAEVNRVLCASNGR